MNAYSYATHSDIYQRESSIKYITLFYINCDSLSSITLCHTSRDLLKDVTHLEPPIFSSRCIHTCLNRGFVLVRGGFVGGFVWGFFRKVLSGVVFVRPPSVRIHVHPLQQKVKHHFQF